jgi:hypothetical protein
MSEEKRQEKPPDTEAPREWTGTIQIKQTSPIQHQAKNEGDNRKNYRWGLKRYEIVSILIQGGILFATSAYMVTAILQWCALQESNRTSREALTSVQRAFVFATGINLYAPVGAKSAMAIAQIENAGVTAATNLVIVPNRQILQSPKNLGEHFDYPDPVPGPFPSRMLGPRETTISSITPTDPICLDLLAQGKVRLFEWGRITYTDIFGAPHETDFCFFTVGAVVDYPQGSNKSIVFFPCAEHNCVDDACPKPEQRANRTEWQDGDRICRDIALAEAGAAPSPK